MEVGCPLVITSAKCGRNMKNPNASKGYLFAHKVNVQLDVLRPAMMSGVGGKIHRGDIVTVDNRGLRDVVMKLLK